MFSSSGWLIVPPNWENKYFKWILDKMVRNFNWLSSKCREESFYLENDKSYTEENNKSFEEESEKKIS